MTATEGTPEQDAMLIGYETETINVGAVLHMVKQKDHKRLMQHPEAGADVVLSVMRAELAYVVGLRAPAGMYFVCVCGKVFIADYQQEDSTSGLRLSGRVDFRSR